MLEEQSIAFSRRSIFAYYILHHCHNRDQSLTIYELMEKTDNSLENNDLEKNGMLSMCGISMKHIENIRKTYKCHRLMEFLDIKFTKEDIHS